MLGEIDAQLDSLKRQARQATRYQQPRRRDPQGRGAAVALIAWRDARGAVAEAERRLEADLREVAERTRATRPSRRGAGASRAAALPALRDARRRRGAPLQRLALAATQLEAEEKRAEERVAELERGIAQLAAISHASAELRRRCRRR